MFKNFVLLCLGLCTLFLAATGCQAKSFALLVGVSDYDESIGLADLRGPRNDVILLRDVLQERAAFDIRMLADGVDGAERPTRDAILAALKKLTQDAKSGDFVYIHLSGHGTQQADRNGDETDGLDEVFLPADTKRAEPGTAVIPNAIIDEELGQYIIALRQNGVDVWLVLDSCHSGSGLRAASPRVVARFVDPKLLGVNVKATPQSAQTAAIEGTMDAALPGRFLAFYSAQSSEVAREIQIDETAEDSWYGLFTSRLAARMQSDAQLSYRQLFQAVLADLDDASIPGGARLQTPLWDGDLIDAPVFGGGELIGVRQFSVVGNRIQAGLLHGLIDNAVVMLVADATAQNSDVLAYAQLQDTDARTALIATVRGDCVSQVAAPCPRIGALPQEAKFARLVAKPRDVAIRIAPPIDLTTGIAVPDDHPLVTALTSAVEASNADLGTRIQLDAGANVLSAIAGGKLWFGLKLTAGNTPIGLNWTPEDGSLEVLLQRIARAEELAATFGNVAGTPSLLFQSPVKILAQRKVSDATRLGAVAPTDLYGECNVAQSSATVSDELPQSQNLKQCDEMTIGAIGVVQGPARDLNRIYIDSQFCVQTEYQRVEGVTQPAILGDPITICSDCPDGDDIVIKTGVERLFVVITEAEANSEALNLEGLLENCVQNGSATRSANTTQVDGFLTGLNNQGATRGSMGGMGISNIWVEAFSWQVLPRKEALAQAGLGTQ